MLYFVLFQSGVYAQEETTIKKFPTDDAMVITNEADPIDKMMLKNANAGNSPFLNVSYQWDTTTEREKIISMVYYRFDLSDLNQEQILTAELKLVAKNIYSDKDKIGIDLMLSDSDWNEYLLTFNNKPPLDETPISYAEISSPDEWYTWNVTEAVKKNAGLPITFVAAISGIKQGNQATISFVTKETSIEEQIPYLELKLSDYEILEKQGTTSKKASAVISNDPFVTLLRPIDDAYVISNINDPNDSANLRKTNYGDLEFLKLWYAWNVTESNEKVISYGNLKVDLSEIEPDFSHATLCMVAARLHINQNHIAVSVHPIDDDNWNEDELVYNNKPIFGAEPLSTVKVSETTKRFGWDVTDFAKENIGSEMSLAIFLENLKEGYEEQAVFVSTEGGLFAPTLEFRYSGYIETGLSCYDLTNELTSVERITQLEKQLLELQQQNEGGGCLIATATYGTELAPQVQLLRELRDNTLLQTNSGTAFIKSFNDVYYSFSPIIADYERENPVFQEIVKIAITPLISSLSILNYVDMDSEESVLGYGISIITLNLVMYGIIPTIVLCQLKNRINSKQ